MTQVENAAHAFLAVAEDAFAAANKPANLPDSDWQKVKVARIGIAHNALAWAAASKKDYSTAENEYTQSLTINPDQGTTSAQYARMLYDEKNDKKIQDALFHYARAAQYTGPGPSLTVTGRPAVDGLFQQASIRATTAATTARTKFWQPPKLRPYRRPASPSRVLRIWPTKMQRPLMPASRAIPVLAFGTR